MYIASLNDRKQSYYDDYKNIGIFIHDDCWSYIKQKYKIELKIGDLDSSKIIRGNTIPNINYHGISQYWYQDFDFIEAITDNNFWMCESPLVSKKNASRINKIIKQFNLKKDRTGPTQSASMYTKGTIKYGNNNKFWIVKNNKWIEMPGKISTDTVEFENKHCKIPQIGESNTKPIFIKDFSTKNKQKYVTILKLN